MNRSAVFAAVAGAFLLAAVPAKADPFDGQWQVTIVTKKGSCDKAYAYAFAVKNGVVSYAGQGGFDISGKVQDNGQVRVRIALGGHSAVAAGRLSAKAGSGSWSEGSNSCSGVWKASRKSAA